MRMPSFMSRRNSNLKEQGKNDEIKISNWVILDTISYILGFKYMSDINLLLHKKM